MLSLLNKIDLFYKIASSIKVPDTLLNEVTDYVLSCFCHNILEELPRTFILHDEDKLMIAGICQKLTSNFSSSEPRIFSLNSKELNINPKEDITCYVKVNTLENSSNNQAAYEHYDDYKRNNDHLLGTIYYYQNLFDNNRKYRTLEQFESLINDYKLDIYHELQHFIQDFIDFAKNIEYNTIGWKEDEEYTTRDIEFYTLLRMNIVYFNFMKTKFPLRLHKDLFLYWTNQISRDEFIIKSEIHESSKEYKTIMSNLVDIRNKSKMFRLLKTTKPDKYRKACVELYKAAGL